MCIFLFKKLAINVLLFFVLKDIYVHYATKRELDWFYWKFSQFYSIFNLRD